MDEFPEIFKSAIHTVPNIIIKQSHELSSEEKLRFKTSITEENLYFIAHQGKSIHPGLWKYSIIRDSNKNLKEISPKILAEANSYVLHDIEKELASKVVIFQEK